MASTWLWRDPEVAVVTGADELLVVRANEAAHLRHVDSELASRLLEATALPVSRQTLTQRFAGTAAAGIELLLSEGVLIEGKQAELQQRFDAWWGAADARPCRRLVVCVSGAVHAVNIGTTLSFLKQQFCDELDVVLTQSATRFVSATGLGYLGMRVWTDLFAREHGVGVPHIHLAESADLVLVLPASARSLYKLAHGACEDLASLVIAATRAPV